MCIPIATAIQACQCDSSPLAMKKWLVHPGSAPNRQQPSAPAKTAIGASNAANIRDPRTTNGAVKRKASWFALLTSFLILAFALPIAAGNHAKQTRGPIQR